MLPMWRWRLSLTGGLCLAALAAGCATPRGGNPFARARKPPAAGAASKSEIDERQIAEKNRAARQPDRPSDGTRNPAGRDTAATRNGQARQTGGTAGSPP